MRDRDSTHEQIDKLKQQKKLKDRARKRERIMIIKMILLSLLIVGAWIGIVYGGYYYSLNYLEEMEERFAIQIDSLIRENRRIEMEIKETMQLFHGELEHSNRDIMQIRNELNMIQEELALTGETITGSDETRLSLQQRISELDRQLAALRTQLGKLEDAVRAF